MELREEMGACGWKMFDNVQRDEIQKLASDIGVIIPYKGKDVFELTSKDTGPGRSLSSIYGLNSFPLHTDGLTLKKSINYIFLFSEDKSTTATKVLSHRALFKSKKVFDYFKRLTCIVDCGTKTLCSPVSGSWEDPIIRFDPRFCKSAGSSFDKMFKDFQDKVESSDYDLVTYNENSLLCIDNRKCLHGRQAVKDIERKLTRIHIG